MDIVSMIEEQSIGKVLKNEFLTNYTTFKVGGIAKVVVYPEDIEKLKELMKILNENGIKYKVLGNGSNVIFKGDIFDGVIIKLDNFDELKIENNEVVVDAGYDLIKLALKVSKSGLSGFEFATGIPGTVGGAVFMNAGAYLKQISDILIEATFLTPELKIVTLSNADLKFSYRSSILSKKPGYICLSAKFKLEEKNVDDIMNLIEDRKARRIDSQPLEYPSAGSTFKNPDGMFAAKLIEDIHLKGYMIGGAQVSEKHANFIINKDDATANDIINLIDFVKARVKDEHNVDLLLEQEIVE